MQVVGQPPSLLAIAGDSHVVEALIGSADLPIGDAPPVTALGILPGSVSPGATLEGSEPWSDWLAASQADPSFTSERKGRTWMSARCQPGCPKMGGTLSGLSVRLGLQAG
jgi:hypothetical protein